jgi:hypothetical protein
MMQILLLGRRMPPRGTANMLHGHYEHPHGRADFHAAAAERLQRHRTFPAKRGWEA